VILTLRSRSRLNGAARALASVLGQQLVVTSFATAKPAKQMTAPVTSQRSSRNPSRRPRQRSDLPHMLSQRSIRRCLVPEPLETKETP
jgi:hypothetical protein